MFKRAHLVSFSPCGGTDKVVESLARDLPLPKQKHNITLPGNRLRDLNFSRDDLVFLGFPVYGGRMPRHFSSLFAKLKGAETPAALVAVYGNRAYEGAFLDMHETARANGFKPIAAIAEHSASPRIAADRPDAEDTRALAELGMRVLGKAQGGAGEIAAPGAYPTWLLPADAFFFPITDPDACTRCGNCVQVCPTAAIPAASPHTTGLGKCTSCAACVKYCPQKARTLGDAKTRQILAPHLANAVARKEPVLFV